MSGFESRKRHWVDRAAPLRPYMLPSTRIAASLNDSNVNVSGTMSTSTSPFRSTSRPGQGQGQGRSQPHPSTPALIDTLATVEELGRLTRLRTWGSIAERGGSNPPGGTMRLWRNLGIRTGLRSRRSKGHSGSNPGSRTARVVEWMVDTAASKPAAPAWA